jgi:hypothetical protein
VRHRAGATGEDGKRGSNLATNALLPGARRRLVHIKGVGSADSTNTFQLHHLMVLKYCSFFDARVAIHSARSL